METCLLSRQFCHDKRLCHIWNPPVAVHVWRDILCLVHAMVSICLRRWTVAWVMPLVYTFTSLRVAAFWRKIFSLKKEKIVVIPGSRRHSWALLGQRGKNTMKLKCISLHSPMNKYYELTLVEKMFLLTQKCWENCASSRYHVNGMVILIPLLDKWENDRRRMSFC